MFVRPPYTLPETQQRRLKYAKALEWITIGFLITIIVVMYLVMGNSQAMKTAWIEDVLSLIPPILFLTSVHYHHQSPNERFPYGYRRLLTVSFMGAAAAVTILSLYMLYDSAVGLIKVEHPTIGMITLFGWKLWMGWVMIAALAYSVIPPVILGRLKLKPANDLHEKTLYADAVMNKADWMTGLAGIIGIVGIGYGLWWADSVAAIVIALDVLKDGLVNMKGSIEDLIDQRPTTVDRDQAEDLADRIIARLRELGWVDDADVRLRTEGELVAGEAYVVPRDPSDLLAHIAEAKDAAKGVHWRIYDIVVQPVDRLDRQP